MLRRAVRQPVLSLLFQTQFSDKPVQDRGLVVTDIKAEDVVLEHRSYCSARARERNFAGEVLGYITPVSQEFCGAEQGCPHGWCSILHDYCCCYETAGEMLNEAVRGKGTRVFLGIASYGFR